MRMFFPDNQDFQKYQDFTGSDIDVIDAEFS
jgi:hypothetical protein